MLNRLFTKSSCFIRNTYRRYLHTIFALSSGRGTSGVAVVRISGPLAIESLRKIAGFEKKLRDIRPRYAYFRRLTNPNSHLLIDRGLVLWFPKPNSFTGEDVVEFHVHGGPAVVKSLFSALSSLKGYRIAEPGEFMKRSFHNGKIDLGGAEAVADLIVAETEAQHTLAVSQVDRTKERIELYASWRRMILTSMAAVEAWIDFSDSDDLEDDVLVNACLRMKQLREEILQRTNDARRGQRLREGIQVAILGPPNAGKSSLMNILCCDDEVSIVSPIAGTTRDAIERPCDVGGYPIILVDTAGLRRETNDPIEKIGVQRSKARAHSADLLIFMLDASHIDSNALSLDWVEKSMKDHNISLGNHPGTPVLVIFNKIDLVDNQNRRKYSQLLNYGKTLTVKNIIRLLTLSCTTRLGLQELTQAITEHAQQVCGNFASQQDAPLVSGLRQANHLNQAADLLLNFIEHQEANDGVLAAEYLRLAIRELGKLTGEVSSKEVLDEIFGSFCIGK